jgi:hypothetical protein
VAVVVDGESGKVSGSVLHDDYCIMDTPQHRKEDEGVSAW